MTQIVLDATLRSKLLNLRQPLDICDESGIVLAHVIPVTPSADHEPVEPPHLSEEELRKRKTGTKWFTTAEVLQHLENP